MSELDPILEQVREMHALKARDYGRDDEPFHNVVEAARFAGLRPWVAAMIRANDKAGRLSLVAQGHAVVNDSVEDDFLDGITYWCIAYALWLRDHQPPNPDLLKTEPGDWHALEHGSPE